MTGSVVILDELREHLIGKFGFSAQDGDNAVGLLRSQLVLVRPVELGRGVCRDPDDDRVLATAVAAGADCIVTGDRDLLVIERYEGIDILSPRQFLEFEAR